MKIYFPIHLDGGNRGCEAIAKGTAIILGLPKEDMIGLCNNKKLDNRLGVSEYVTLWSRPLWLRCFKRFYDKYKRLTVKDDAKKANAIYWSAYSLFLHKIGKDDVMLSTGGDMMCYSNNQVIYTNNEIHKRGRKTVLWGCSIGKENLTPEKIETLKNFTLIYARESLTAEMLKSELGLDNVVTFPDPAFVLKPQRCQLPKAFEKDVIGINLSNYVLANGSFDNPFGKEVSQMIDYILKETKLNVLLIPHVLWTGQDDRTVSQAVASHYQCNPRLTVLDSDKLNYCELRYVISKCRFFIGARTHAVISAYSTCVPTLALGYSVKSRGIAKDLSLPEQLVINSKNIKKGELLNSLKFLISNEDSIKKHLQSVMTEYVGRLKGIKIEISQRLGLL